MKRKSQIKTYSHLAERQRLPSDYELGSSDLLPYLRSKKFELELPIVDWYKAYQTKSPLQCDDWERYSDPRQITYGEYTALRTVSEQFVDKILQMIDEEGADKSWSAAWIGVLESILAPMRYPFHALQMAAAYVGQMAPSGKIAICCALQAADEMRVIQRIAYRIGQLRRVHPDFADSSRKSWENDDVWQETRKLLESLLVTYDWGEAFCALNLIVKPTLETVLMGDFPRLARKHGDEHLATMFSSLQEDAAWHAEWSQALVAFAVAKNPANKQVLAGWQDKWQPLADTAQEQFRELLFKMI